jgi:MalT-like TPR region
VLDGDLDSALERFMSAMTLVGELGAHDDESWMHVRLADVHLRRGDLVSARASADRGYELAERTGWPWQILYARAAVADLAHRAGEVAEAHAITSDVLERLDGLPPVHPFQAHGIAVAYALVAGIELRDGDVTAAREHTTKAYDAAVGTDDQSIMAAVGVIVARLREAGGAQTAAAEALGASAALRGADDPTHPDIAALTKRLGDALGHDVLAAAHTRGRALDRDAALAALDPRTDPAA